MTAVIRGLYYSYISTSQSYLTARSITDGINTFNKLLVAAELDIVVKLAAELADTIIITKCYIGSTAFLCYTGSTAPSFIANYRQ